VRALIAELARGLLYSWSLWRNNKTVINLQMVSPSYGSRRFAACDQCSYWRFFPPRPVFSVDTCVSRFKDEKSLEKVINSLATSVCSII